VATDIVVAIGNGAAFHKVRRLLLVPNIFLALGRRTIHLQPSSPSDDRRPNRERSPFHRADSDSVIDRASRKHQEKQCRAKASVFPEGASDILERELTYCKQKSYLV
jgi:hypothetical protein